MLVGQTVTTEQQIIIMMGKLVAQVDNLTIESRDAANARKEQYKATEDLRHEMAKANRALVSLESRMGGVEETVSDVKRWRERINGAMFFAGLCGMSVAGFAGWIWNKVLQ